MATDASNVRRKMLECQISRFLTQEKARNLVPKSISAARWFFTSHGGVSGGAAFYRMAANFAGSPGRMGLGQLARSLAFVLTQKP
jgi:hypothetical protein